MGVSFVGSLSKLSDEQLRVVQERIGFGAETLLATPAQWRAAYRGRPLPPLPEGAIALDAAVP